MLEDKYTMQNQCYSNVDDKFVMNFGAFDAESLFNAPMGGTMNMVGVKRSAHEAGLVDRDDLGLSSDDDGHILKKDDHHHQHKLHASSSDRENLMHHHHHSQTSLDHHSQQSADSKQTVLPNGKKTKGRVKIKMEFIDNKLRRYTTFSKRKTGIMKKAYELSTLTGTQVMLLVASETGHVYTFATRKLQPMITSEAGKALIQTCLNSPDPPSSSHHHPHHNHHDQRMSATGYEETELTYAVTEEEHKVRQMMYSSTGGHINAMHHSPTIASPSPHLALQSHPHAQYQTHPSINQPPHINASSGHPHHPNPTNHADHIGMNHHGPHLAGPPPTPLSAQSPLPPHSPICTSSSPTSPYPHHHPHHAALQAHTR